MSKIQNLLAQIFDRESQIIHSHSESRFKFSDRRRTWCPSSKMEKIAEETSPLEKNNQMVPPPFILKSQDSVSPYTETDFSPTNDFLSNEVFQSPDKVQFDDRFATDSTRKEPFSFNTPKSLKPTQEVESPYVGKPKTTEHENKILKERIKYLENELEELQDFKILEEKISSVDTEEIKILNENLEMLRTQLAQNEKKVEILENDVTEKMIEIEKLNGLKSKCEIMEMEHKKAVKDRENAENLLASVEYEYDQAKIKFKNREVELIQSLDEARNDSSDLVIQQKEKIRNLEQLLQKTEEDLFSLEKQKAENGLQKDDNSAKILDLEKIIKEFENKLQASRDERDISEKLLKEKNTEIETLSEQLLEAVQETDNLQSIIKKMEENVKVKCDEVEAITSKLSELEEISNRYHKIQQIITVDQAISEVYYDENDDVYKFIIQMQQTATKSELLETQNKELLSQIAENNCINEEVCFQL